MAKKKEYSSQAKPKDISGKEQDPPVVVGGGGSVRVFIRNGATQITPSPRPGYMCFHLGVNIRKVHIYDGETSGLTSRDVRNADRHFTQFDE